MADCLPQAFNGKLYASGNPQCAREGSLGLANAAVGYNQCPCCLFSCENNFAPW